MITTVFVLSLLLAACSSGAATPEPAAQLTTVPTEEPTAAGSELESVRGSEGSVKAAPQLSW